MKRRTLYRTLALTLLAGSCALAQNPPVPAAYQTTYSELQDYVSNFDSTVSEQWNGKKSNVLWSSELAGANANGGLQLLKSANGAVLQLQKLHDLGLRSVVVNIALPILNQDFYTFNGDPDDFPRMVAYYQNIATQIHNLGMKMVVESAIMFKGSFSTNSGFNLESYYDSLSDTDFEAARVKNILTVAQQIGPDFINLGSEPDTELTLSGKSGLYGSPDAYAATIHSIISQLRAAGVTIPLGAGVGTWLDDGNAQPWVTALLNAGISYLDLHVYPVNFNCLPALITYADMALQAGKPVAISEAWLLKESDAQYKNPPPGNSKAGGVDYYAWDAYSFWAPLDKSFLTALSKFANWKHLLFVSPFWVRYYFAYLDYNQVAGLTSAQLTATETDASNAALSANQETDTAGGYKTNTGGVLQIPAFNAADFLTLPVSTESMIAIFGSNLSSGIASATSLPLPTMLGNTTATIQDNTGNQADLSLFYVSPSQINAAIPTGLNPGVALVTISNQGTVVGEANVIVAAVGPSLFTANANGKGVPIGIVVTAHADGTQSIANVFQGSAVGSFTPAPINLGGTGDQSVLVVFGTGIRGAGALSNVTATIGTINAPVQYAGATDKTHFVALDQVNISLPHSLAGAGPVNLTVTVNGIAAPPVTLNFE